MGSVFFYLVSGKPGSIIRAAYYKLTTNQCSLNVDIDYAVAIAHRDVWIEDRVIIMGYTSVGRCHIGEGTITLSSKIKIAFIIDTIVSPTAGTEKQLLLLIEHLNRNRFAPHLCCLKSSLWLEKEFNLCPLHIIDITSFKHISWPIKLIKFADHLKRSGFDIIQTYFRDGNFVGTIASRVAGIGNVISTRRNRGYWHNRRNLFFIKKLNGYVKRFLSNSDDVRQYTHKIEGIPIDRIDVIYNGLDLKLYPYGSSQIREDARRTLGIDNDALVAGMVANLRPVKAIDTCLYSLVPIISEYPRLTVLIIGEGEDRHRLERLVKDLGIKSHVRFLGARTDVNYILSACDMGVLSSRSESLSNAILEYMAAGLPVVATDVGGTRELVIHGKTGLLVPPDDSESLAASMKEILRDRDKRQAYGAAGRLRAETIFSHVRYVQEHETYYEKLVGGCRIG